MSVDATLTTTPKKTFWQKIGLARSSPENLSYYVCSPECGRRAQEEPNIYLVTVMTRRDFGK